MLRTRSCQFLCLTVCLLAASTLLSCAKQKPVATRGQEAATWGQYISAYTSGRVSCESTIRVQLTADAVPDSMINRSLAKAPISFQPAVAGSAVWIYNSIIEFRPQERLAPDTKYCATFEIGQFVDVPPKLQRFDFEFTTIAQNVQVNLEGLQAMSDTDLAWQRLLGTLSTADVAMAGDAEKVVEARQGGKKLSLSWHHDADRFKHRFSIDSIRRGDKASEVIVTWNGAPLKVSRKDEERVTVPALGDFSVLEVSATKGAEHSIIVRFSDPIDSKQDLRGLISLGEEQQPRFTIERNEVRAYPSAPLKATLLVTINAGVRNIAGSKLKNALTQSLLIENVKPQVRFSGEGVIIPSSMNMTISFEAVNLSAIEVRAIRIYENNIPQFLQVNDLSGKDEMRRVGRVVWRQTINLDVTPDMHNRWVSCGFNPAALLAGGANALYRIEISFQKCHSLYPCENPDTTTKVTMPRRQGGDDDEGEPESSFWDTYESGDNDGYDNAWEHREDPCSPGYYRDYWDHKITVARNFLVSDMGLIAKRGANDSILIAALDLPTNQPCKQIDVQVRNYQNQTLGSAITDDNGMATVVLATGKGKPFLLIADNGKQKGYLKLDDGNCLAMSQFDVAGSGVPKGLKGMLYGERGVWRPGDSLFLTFVLEDKQGRLPEDHPVTMELINPRGQLVQTITRTQSVRRFYNFATITSPDAPTGTYTARLSAGGARFEFPLKVETVMPNRLKVRLDFGRDTISATAGELSGTLTARWLTGAIARDLLTVVDVTMQPVPTRFSRFADYLFDDPARRYETESQTIFNGTLNNEGMVTVDAELSAKSDAPGLLQANFRSRVFEEGGAFSVDRMSVIYSPYPRYIGILPPKGDRARGMLLTDTLQRVRIVSVAVSGAPVKTRHVQVTLYKIDWRWWWDRGEESLSNYITSEHHHVITRDTVATNENGEGEFTFTVKYPEWGRFMLRAVDLDGGHATGKIVYIDWPGWAGRSQKDNPAGASILAFTSDKPEYTPSENATLTIPTSKQGRIFISIENGSRVLKQYWIAARDSQTIHNLPITADMSPNVFIYAAYIQPYGQSANDLPIRMYGVIPLRVVDPQTRLKPTIACADVLAPESRASVSVGEESGREMVYTLAIVDEGLLDLTRFETPNLWKYFFQREALGVKTWDLFDLVCGAYGAKLERLLAIGGDDDGLARASKKRGNRFPPMVRFYGPFQLKRGKVDKHDIDIPNYVGSVRIMVVAGQDGAYGSTERAVPVRKPLMVLGTLPRVLGPDETVSLPVSVFALEKGIKEAKVKIDVQGMAAIVGEKTLSVSFAEPGDELVVFKLKAGVQAGPVTVNIAASSGGEKASQTIELMVRNPNLPFVKVVDTVLQAGASWGPTLELPGVAGTNSAAIELSTIPPLNLGKRLDFLITYPHGCVEQTTSGAFPQLFLPDVVELSVNRKADIQHNVGGGIERLVTFQTSRGGFSYWPDGGDPDAWASCYAGHFIVEAKNSGYSLPPGMLERWIKFQRDAALSWSGKADQAELIQAYRLYTLALAQAPEIGAMNRLRESGSLPVAALWRLAAAYQIGGRPEIAKEMVANAATIVKPYRELSQTYGSDARDEAMILEAMVLMNDISAAAKLATALSQSLCTEEWMSTQSTAYCLLAMAKFARHAAMTEKIEVQLETAATKSMTLETKTHLMLYPLELADNAARAKIALVNRSKGFVYVRCMLKGIPATGKESAVAEGLRCAVRYLRKPATGYSETEIDPEKIFQGTDIIAEVTIADQKGLGPYQQVALTQIFPSGWEIRNARFEGDQTGSSACDYQDIRDDRIYTYCTVPRNGSLVFRTMLNAAYLGSYYLPAVRVEAMYDASINACAPGKWIKVLEVGE
jgi:uncharacterized protein YfaS (alpha-2-macroglobulin family)